MKYYVELGFERYTKRFEITKEIYDKRVTSSSAYLLGGSNTYCIRLVKGEVNFRADEVKYVEFISE